MKKDKSREEKEIIQEKETLEKREEVHEHAGARKGCHEHICHEHAGHEHAMHACSGEHSKECRCENDKNAQDIKIAEITELLQRVHADFVNYKRRVQEESKVMAKCASEDVVAKLLPVLDNFELALQHKDNKEEFAKGIELIHSQLLDTLKKEGLTEIKALDHKFDPKEHEALMIEKSDKEDGIVIEEFQKGYKLGDKVLRMSKVKVSKK